MFEFIAKAKKHLGDGARFFFAPGRVNLIGEHIDYNGGNVFPCALSMGTYAAVKRRKDRLVRLISGNINMPCKFNLDSLQHDKKDGWANYPKGVISEFMAQGCELGGFDMMFWGNIPSGAGLSSSASIELATACAINTIFSLGLTTKQLALLAQRAENRFVGVNCGIMDQYAVSFGREGYALLLDCDRIEHDYVPFYLGEYSLVIANTNKKHALGDSKYNERRAECEQALSILKRYCDISSLCQLSVDEFELNVSRLEGAIKKRATHAVYENARVNAAVQAIRTRNLKEFGKLMNQSHASLKALYEVTGFELDTLYNAALKAGAVGARMTGAGFGGCTINIVHDDKISEFIKVVGEEYHETTKLKADFYIAQTEDGVRELNYG